MIITTVKKLSLVALAVWTALGYAENKAKPNTELSLELLEFLADYSDDQGKILDPESLEPIAEANQPNTSGCLQLKASQVQSKSKSGTDKNHKPTQKNDLNTVPTSQPISENSVKTTEDNVKSLNDCYETSKVGTTGAPQPKLIIETEPNE
jgi:hypothetical protein